MSKTIEVKGCKDCIFIRPQNLQLEMCCQRSNYKPIPLEYTIMDSSDYGKPDWCPLKQSEITVKLNT